MADREEGEVEDANGDGPVDTTASKERQSYAERRHASHRSRSRSSSRDRHRSSRSHRRSHSRSRSRSRDRRDRDSDRHRDRDRDRDRRDRDYDRSRRDSRRRDRSRTPEGRRRRGDDRYPEEEDYRDRKEREYEMEKNRPKKEEKPVKSMEPAINSTVNLEELDEEGRMMAMMGLPVGFDTTKGKHVDGNEDGVAKLASERHYRQFVNRRAPKKANAEDGGLLWTHRSHWGQGGGD